MVHSGQIWSVLFPKSWFPDAFAAPTSATLVTFANVAPMASHREPTISGLLH